MIYEWAFYDLFSVFKKKHCLQIEIFYQNEFAIPTRLSSYVFFVWRLDKCAGVISLWSVQRKNQSPAQDPHNDRRQHIARWLIVEQIFLE